MTDATVNEAPPKTGIWEDFIDILHQPSEVFERRRAGQFGLALVILVVISTILYFALRNGLAPITDAEIDRQAAAMMEKNPAMTSDQVSGMKKVMETVALFGTIVFIPVGVLITGLLIWLAGKLLDAKTVFAAAMMIATYSQVPRILELVLSALQGLFLAPEAITSRYSVTLGIGRFLSPDTDPVVLTLLGGIDLFTIWTLVLMAVGVSVVARVPVKRGAIVVAIVWIVGMLPGLFQAMSQ